MTAIGGGILLGTVGIELTMQCIQTITGYAQSIYSVASCISYISKNEDAISAIKKYDIELKVKILESMVNNLKMKKHSSAYKICLNGLKDCLKLIDSELKCIKTKIEYNNAIWFLPTWRSYMLTENLKKLEIYNDMLDTRKKIFFDVLSIDNELTSEESAILVRQFANDQSEKIMKII